MPKTNCGQTIEVNCIDCYKKIQTWCHKCVNINLRQQIRELENQLAFIRHESDDQFDQSDRYIKKIQRHPEPIKPFELSTNTYFFTITFDPSRFMNLGSDNGLEEIYILNQLYDFIKTGQIFDLYGSFELTNQGITHAHVNIKTYLPVELKRSLKERFTWNPKNNIAIHCGLANTKSLAYINKIEAGKGTENKTWFSLKQTTDYGLDYMPEFI